MVTVNSSSSRGRHHRAARSGRSRAFVFGLLSLLVGFISITIMLQASVYRRYKSSLAEQALSAFHSAVDSTVPVHSKFTALRSKQQMRTQEAERKPPSEQTDDDYAGDDDAPDNEGSGDQNIENEGDDDNVEESGEGDDDEEGKSGEGDDDEEEESGEDDAGEEEGKSGEDDAGEEQEESGEDDADEEEGESGEGDEEDTPEKQNVSSESGKSWWKRTKGIKMSKPKKASEKPAIVPFDLSVNNLQLIELAGGVGKERIGAAEDFLPIVVSERINLRFRLQGVVGASPGAMKDISAYRVVAKLAHAETKDDILWDSKQVDVDTMPISIPWSGKSLAVGSIVAWQVQVWDHDGVGPAASEWSKFGVGPSQDEWTGKWISHPADVAKFEEARDAKAPKRCDLWTDRRPLPLFRAKFDSSQEDGEDVVSALLVVSGLGSFSASVDGIPLSSSSPLDPPLTEYTQRIPYRGFDVTTFFVGKKNRGAHVVGLTLGSGWWDGRPLTGGIVKFDILPRGALTGVAELHLTMKNGETKVKIPSGTGGEWQVAKGHIRDSDLFTGETVDIGLLAKIRGWDTPDGWNAVGSTEKESTVSWSEPILYESPTTSEKWRKKLAQQAVEKQRQDLQSLGMAPIGHLIPAEAPPVLPIEAIEPESIVSLGEGRWLLDFGKAMSGVVRFDEGLPAPIVPEGEYPRAHNVDTMEGVEEQFITVVYGESLEMETGDINLVLVAGMGLHDGGPRHVSKSRDTQKRGGPCFPKDHGQVLTQRDVFIAPKASPAVFAEARQSLFTTHGFRFAEVCCTENPPKQARALMYRTAFAEWGKFDSSNILLNGAHELSRNAFNSNMLGVQSDCPHREKLQYGGDLMSDSPGSMHLFDLSAFYGKIIHDWKITQWENGAYTESTPWQSLNDERGVGKGAGETVWASLPAVLTVRHLQHYGDTQLMEETFDHHYKWMKFLQDNWEAAMKQKYEDLQNYKNSHAGLGDWLSMGQRDTWLTHNAFFMATARSVAYMAEKLKDGQMNKEASTAGAAAMSLAKEMKAKITDIMMKNGQDTFTPPNADGLFPGPEMSLFSRIVPGHKRCIILKNLLHRRARGNDFIWPGAEERLFLSHLNRKDRDDMVQSGVIRLNGKNENGEDRYDYPYGWRHHTPEGIFAIRYALKTWSDMGFHNIALSKATGVGIPSFEYMLSHNATTMWETWWRSEDVYSRNHPMFGAVAEWLASSVAGMSLAPSTTGGKELLLWPRIPTSALVVEYASATQGTKRGDASIAWKFVNLPEDRNLFDSAVVNVQIRAIVPPGTTAVFRLPDHTGMEDVGASIRYAKELPDIDAAISATDTKCLENRRAGMGFNYNWEYDREKKEWSKFYNGKAIGTPCPSFLFDSEMEKSTAWSEYKIIDMGKGGDDVNGVELPLDAGYYDVLISDWQLVKEIDDNPGYRNYEGDLGPYCLDSDSHDWDINDATHLI